MIEAHERYTNIRKPNLPDWRVFVQSKYLGSRHLAAGTYVLYEVYWNEIFNDLCLNIIILF